MRPLLAAAALLLSGCGSDTDPTKPASAPKRRPSVGVREAVPEKIEHAVETVGTLEATEEIDVAAGVAGLVEAVNFREGDRVTPETVLLEVDVERYRLVEAKARADVDRTRAQAEMAETLYENRRKLHEEGKKQQKEWITDEQLAQWRADLARARAELARAEAELGIAARDHRQSRVRPSVTGLINRRTVSRGEYVRIDTVVAGILDLSTLHVKFTVPELEASRLVLGQEILFSLRSAPGEGFRARLFHLSQKADPATRAVEGRAEVLERRDSFRAGYFVNVKAVTGAVDALMIPERAALPTEHGFVVRVVENGAVRTKPVRLGLRYEGRVEIVQGLAAGETVIVDGATTVRDGQEVEAARETAR